MNRKSFAAGAYAAAAALSAAVAPSALGQTAPAPAPEAPAADDDLVVLSPFVVSATESNSGYSVKDTLAGTRIRTELKDVASSLVVVNKQLMQDIGATGSESLLQYTGNTEVGGVAGNFLGGNYPSSSDSYGQNANLLRPSSNTRVRGLDAADNTRDFFLTEIPWDSYNVDRVDIQRGPNSILFGVGSPAGIVNTSVNPASYKTAYTFENKVDKWGSLRNSLDLNQVLIANTLAVRVAGLDDRKKYEQKPAYEHSKRVYAALRFDPKLIEGGLTSLRANFEHGSVKANRPRTLTPEDCITPWFYTGVDENGVPGLNKRGWNAATESPDSTVNKASKWTNGVTIGRQYWPGTVGYYSDPTGSTAPFYMTPMIGVKNGIDSNGVVAPNGGDIGGLLFARYFNIGSYKQYASNTNFDGAGYYSTKSLTDASIFDFYKNLIDGDNKREWQNWNAGNIALSQTLLNNRVGFELVYDVQRYKDGQESLFNGGGAYALNVDINTHLIDGSVNPNFGRPFVAGGTESGGNDSSIARDGLRFTAFAELRAEDFLKKSWLTEVLGRHVFTGLVSRDTKVQRDRQYALDLANPDYPEYIHEDPALGGHIRAYNWQVYLGSSLAGSGITSASGANIDRIRASITSPASAPVRIFDSTWTATTVDPAAPYTFVDKDGVTITSTQSENPANYRGWRTYSVDFKSVARGDKESLITSDSRKRNQITSEGATWQGYMFNGNFVPVLGWRKDTVKTRKGEDLPDTFGMVDGQYDYNPASATKVTDESLTWGGVLHTPTSIRNKLPGRTGISVFYNRSSNFKADEPRQDVFGTLIDNPRAQTKEYGFAVSTFDDRLTLKVNWYTTRMKNATLPYGTGFSYQQWAYPAWFVAHVAKYQAVRDGRISDAGWDYDFNPAMLTAALADAKNLPIPQSFFTSYGRELATINATAFASGDYYGAWPLWSAGRVDPQPGNASIQRVGSGDTTSKGIEFELVAQPFPNWNVTVNVSKVKAQYDAISPTISKYMEDMTAFFAGPAGDIRMWGEGWEGGAFRTRWEQDVVSSYNTLLAYVGNSAPEVAPWRANAITTYTFTTGFMKDVYVGGGYRWEDKKILGYGLVTDAALGKKVPSSSLPLYGDSEDHFDLWIGYSRKLTDKLNWRIQLNVRNLGEKHHLLPASLQPDGTWALARIAEGMTWQLSNTFSF
ncbi:MAG: hypothetical protein QM691_12605 [Opitutaceae bacterium]